MARDYWPKAEDIGRGVFAQSFAEWLAYHAIGASYARLLRQCVELPWMWGPLEMHISAGTRPAPVRVSEVESRGFFRALMRSAKRLYACDQHEAPTPAKGTAGTPKDPSP